MSTGLLERLGRRVALQPLREMKDCCAAEMAKGFPSMLGAQKGCPQCGEVMKAVRAVDFDGNDFVGALGEAQRHNAVADIAVNKIWFSKNVWKDVEDCRKWIDGVEGLPKTHGIVEHFFAYEFKGVPVQPNTNKAVCADKGVIVEIGLPFEKQITTGSLLGGGLLNPAQGTEMAGPYGTLASGPASQVTGNTDQADGDSHVHKIDAALTTDADGPMLKCRTSVAKNHQHVVRIPYAAGSIDGMTDPSASIIGGHSHAHRFRWSANPVTAAKVLSSPRLVSPRDIANIRRAAGILEVAVAEKAVTKTSGVPEGKAAEIAVSSEDLEAVKELIRRVKQIADRWDEEVKGDH